MLDIKSGRTAKKCIIGDFQQFSFEEAIEQLDPAVASLSSTFPSRYEDDFKQVGRIGIWNAFEKLAVLQAFTKFRPYAMRAAKFGMIDFYRQHVKRQLPLFDPPPPSLIFDYDASDFLNDCRVDPAFYVTPDFGMDYDVIFSEKSLKENKFSRQEIQMFSLHLELGYTVTEMAGQLHVSPGQVSKVLSRTLVKTADLWEKSTS